ncbi:MAG TPA: HIT domain-containing protein [candidate division WOR-3 bacterium]|uniref:HIT domain-containing protein n=1 Tax=candidate division WOR-3 bacterium TaxID=2052148 RepID=A0A9C9K0K9_UNCW3|nr:HIT domain-containing protein [candidate division WOR-3 bacterium]
MSEVRRDIVTDTWVIIDTENDSIPEVVREDKAAVADCPFCEGQERRTPTEIYAVRESCEPDGPGWKVRVIPNIKPILKVEGALEKSGVGVYDMVSGVGANEVIVESPRHIPNFFELPREQIKLVLETYRLRIEDLHKDKRLRYILIFKNHGRAAGASTIDHPHSDLIALPATPIRVKQKLNGAREYYSYKERCLFCDIIQQEIEMADRLIFQSDKFVVIAPYASRFPFEILILPKRHSFSYTLITEEETGDLAMVLKRIFKVMYKVLNDPPYNLIINNSPNLLPKSNYWKTIKDDFHWHIEITPRLYRRTGFELGTGFYINRFAPEKAAAIFRKEL